MKLYVARHGQTDWNLKSRIQGSAEIPLNETGLRQAEELREKIKDLDFDVCYSSPVKRALKTAQIAVDGKHEIIVDDRLKERGFGEFEGRPVTDWMELTGGIDLFDRKLNFAGKGVEPVNSVMDRAEDFLAFLRKTYPADAKILVVAHAGFLRTLHYAIVGYDDDTNFIDFHIKNGELKEYEI